MKPYFYKQTDKRWATYSWHGMTIGGGGCGPTSIANVVSPLRKKVTPKTVFKWLCKHGYILPGVGTYHSGITAALKHWKIKFKQTYSDAEAKKSLKKGQWVLGVVGRSRWTSSGHFIVLYGLTKSGHVLVSDPYSSSDYCQKQGTWNEYAKANKNNWICIDPKDYKARENDPKSTKTYIMYTDSELSNVRAGHAKNTKVVAKLARGTKLTLHNYYKGWYQIKKGKYKGKWIGQSHLTNLPPYVAKWQTQSQRYIRNGATTKADIIGKAPKGKSYVSSKMLGDWVFIPSVDGWIRYKSHDGKKKYMKKL